MALLDTLDKADASYGAPYENMKKVFIDLMDAIRIVLPIVKAGLIFHIKRLAHIKAIQPDSTAQSGILRKLCRESNRNGIILTAV